MDLVSQSLPRSIYQAHERQLAPHRRDQPKLQLKLFLHACARAGQVADVHRGISVADRDNRQPVRKKERSSPGVDLRIPVQLSKFSGPNCSILLRPFAPIVYNGKPFRNTVETEQHWTRQINSHARARKSTGGLKAACWS